MLERLHPHDGGERDGDGEEENPAGREFAHLLGAFDQAGILLVQSKQPLQQSRLGRARC